jgi:phosphoribosylformimino-5-aminoimidazole carboxamide ribotide isomerase
MAQRWEKEGASLIHVVDLDGAFAKEVRNLKTIQTILSGITVPIQVGGGIRDLKTIELYINMGVSRIIIGSEAVYNPNFVKEACLKFKDRIVVGIDARNGMVAVEGWGQHYSGHKKSS